MNLLFSNLLLFSILKQQSWKHALCDGIKGIDISQISENIYRYKVYQASVWLQAVSRFILLKTEGKSAIFWRCIVPLWR